MNQLQQLKFTILMKIVSLKVDHNVTSINGCILKNTKR